jgi:hypothetical protein
VQRLLFSSALLHHTVNKDHVLKVNFPTSDSRSGKEDIQMYGTVRELPLEAHILAVVLSFAVLFIVQTRIASESMGNC